MTRDEALKTIQRQAPCPHDSIDASLGDGTVWAKCHDCGATFPQDALARARDAAKQFDDAVEFLQAAQPQAPSVPAGWQLVPVDPTPEMIVTGLCEHIQEPTTEEFCDMYRAMLAAAPPVAQEAAPTQQQPTSPDVRAALLFALYHHQGASSAIGQPIRHALGIERHAPLTDEHCAEADRVDLALRRGAQEAAPADPMDWPLPCDVVVGHGTMRKGVRLGALVSRMKALYEMATGQNADEVAGRSLEQRMAAPGLLQQADAAQEAAGAVAPVIAGALFDFLGYITSRDESLTVGSREWATPAVDALEAWAKTRNLDLTEARVRGWRAALAAAPAEPIPTRATLIAALQWYADGLHFDKASPDAWDTVSGEPQNWWCDEAGTATIEDGSIAAMTLRGELTAEQLQEFEAGEAAAPVGLDAKAATERDAARYRWIRYNTHGESDARGRQQFVMPNPHPQSNIMQGSVAQHLDAAIDAEMAAAPQAQAAPPATTKPKEAL